MGFNLGLKGLNTQILYFMTIRPVEADFVPCGETDRRTDRHIWRS